MSPSILSVNILILDQERSLNKMITLTEDPEGGGMHGGPSWLMVYNQYIKLQLLIVLSKLWSEWRNNFVQGCHANYTDFKI